MYVYVCVCYHSETVDRNYLFIWGRLSFLIERKKNTEKSIKNYIIKCVLLVHYVKNNTFALMGTLSIIRCYDAA